MNDSFASPMALCCPPLPNFLSARWSCIFTRFVTSWAPCRRAAWWIGFFVLCQLFCLLLAVLPFSLFQGTTFCCCCFLVFFGAEVSIAHPRIVGFFAIQHVWSSDYAIALLCESNCKYRHPAESRLFLASCRALGKLVTFWLTNGWQSGRRSECLKASLVPSILTFASRVVVVFLFFYCLFYFGFCFLLFLLFAIGAWVAHWRERSASDILTERSACRAKNDAAGLEGNALLVGGNK